MHISSNNGNNSVRLVNLNLFYSNLIKEKKFNLDDLKKIAENQYYPYDSTPVKTYEKLSGDFFNESLQPFFLLLLGHEDKGSIFRSLPRELISVIVHSLNIEKPPVFSNAFAGKLHMQRRQKGANGEKNFSPIVDPFLNSIHVIIEKDLQYGRKNCFQPLNEEMTTLFSFIRNRQIAAREKLASN